MRNQNNSPAQTQPISHGIDEETLRGLQYRIESLETVSLDLKDEFAKWFKEIQDNLTMKADTELVKALENSLLERFNEIAKALSK